MTKVLLVTGDRDWPSPGAIARYLRSQEFDVLVHGDARGADRLARACAERMMRRIEGFPALWDDYGRSAGRLRNEQMLRRLIWHRKQGHEVRVVAFHNDLYSQSRGTLHMVQIAKKAGIRVTLVKQRLG